MSYSISRKKASLEKERVVTLGEAKQLASSWGIKDIETSAKTNYNSRKLLNN